MRPVVQNERENRKAQGRAARVTKIRKEAQRSGWGGTIGRDGGSESGGALCEWIGMGTPNPKCAKDKPEADAEAEAGIA